MWVGHLLRWTVWALSWAPSRWDLLGVSWAPSRLDLLGVSWAPSTSEGLSSELGTCLCCCKKLRKTKDQGSGRNKETQQKRREGEGDGWQRNRAVASDPRPSTRKPPSQRTWFTHIYTKRHSFCMCDAWKSLTVSLLKFSYSFTQSQLDTILPGCGIVCAPPVWSQASGARTQSTFGIDSKCHNRATIF